MSPPQTPLTSENGQTMAEYALVMSVIAVGVIVALTFLSGGIGAAIDRATALIP
jgi:Flp pilus assembly pilin Flp